MRKRAAKKSAAEPPAGKPGTRSGSARGSERLAELQRLIDVMVDKDVVEVEFEEGGTRWRVRRKEPQHVAYAAQPAMALPPAGGHAPAQPAATGSSAAPSEPAGEVFKSPMLGTFYRAPSPDAEAFAKPGDKVHADTTLCIIEAMKVMNEIKAERDFEILDVLVKNGDPVEFGQPLFLIR